MLKLKVSRIYNYVYYLTDEDAKHYQIHIEFYDLDFKISVGDIIYINEEFLNSDEMYAFGSLRDITGRKVKNSKEMIVIIHDDQDYYLKRLYV